MLIPSQAPHQLQGARRPTKVNRVVAALELGEKMDTAELVEKVVLLVQLTKEGATTLATITMTQSITMALTLGMMTVIKVRWKMKL